MKGIYRLTFPNDHIYIGKSNDIYARWKAYDSLSCDGQPLLKAALVKHGIENVKKEILFEVISGNILEIESKYITIYRNSGAALLNLQGVPKNPLLNEYEVLRIEGGETPRQKTRRLEREEYETKYIIEKLKEHKEFQRERLRDQREELIIKNHKRLNRIFDERGKWDIYHELCEDLSDFTFYMPFHQQNRGWDNICSHLFFKINSIGIDTVYATAKRFMEVTLGRDKGENTDVYYRHMSGHGAEITLSFEELETKAMLLYHEEEMESIKEFWIKEAHDNTMDMLKRMRKDKYFTQTFAERCA